MNKIQQLYGTFCEVHLALSPGPFRAQLFNVEKLGMGLGMRLIFTSISIIIPAEITAGHVLDNAINVMYSLELTLSSILAP